MNLNSLTLKERTWTEGAEEHDDEENLRT